MLSRRTPRCAVRLGPIGLPSDDGGVDQGLHNGATNEGLPYVVMEYIRGEPTTTLGDRNMHDAEERVTLTAEVANAVQHAHDRGHIHRYLMPGTVLVEPDGRDLAWQKTHEWFSFRCHDQVVNVYLLGK